MADIVEKVPELSKFTNSGTNSHLAAPHESDGKVISILESLQNLRVDTPNDGFLAVTSPKLAVFNRRVIPFMLMMFTGLLVERCDQNLGAAFGASPAMNEAQL